MYCGSCLRDNAVAAALLARGHDVVLMPIYTPTTTDEKNVSQSKVLFGGISVYLEQHVPFFRSTPAFLDRLWDSTPVLKLASKRQIKVDPAVLGEMTVSMLKGVDGFQRKEIDKMLRWVESEARFDVVTLPFTLLISLARPLREVLGAPIACTLQGEDLFLESLQEPWKSQALDLIRRSIDDVDVFLAVSDYYVDFMTGYLGIPRDRIRTVPIGINLDGHAVQPTRRSPPFTVGFFARIAPEKGLHVLAEAYRRLRARARRAGDQAARGAAICSMSIGTTWPRLRSRCSRGVWRITSAMPARRIAPARSRCCSRWTSCRCRRRTPNRRVTPSSRPWPTAFPSCNRAAARFRRS